MNWYYDTIIVGFLVLDLAFILLVWKRGSKFLSELGADGFIFLAMLAWGVIFYGSFVEPRQIVVHSQELRLSEQPTHTITAAVIGDTHVGPYKGRAFIEHMIDHIVEINPDVIFLVGDYVYDHGDQVTALEPLANITRVYPTYAVLGNHDYDLRSPASPVDDARAREVEEALTSYGVHVLKNEGVAIDNNQLWLAGVEDIWSHRARIGDALFDRPVPPLPTILLTHNPDTMFFVRHSQLINLVLAGHTHGGQIRLPLIGPVPQIPDELGRHYDKGLFDYDGTPLFITSGIGESGPRARLFNLPEIAALTIEY